MSDLEWTEQPPEEPGWYWVRDKPGNELVLSVYYPDDIEWLCIKTSGGKMLGRVVPEPNGLQWAGPIPEPDA